MAYLRSLSLVFIISCWVILSQAKDYPEARHANDGELTDLLPSLSRSLDFLNWKTTPRPPREHEHTRPIYITYRPPKDKDHPHHYPYYPGYPYPPPHHHYWPRPEEPPHKPKPEEPKPKPEDPGHGHGHHYPHLPPYYPHYPPGHGHGHGPPYIIVINAPPREPIKPPTGTDPVGPGARIFLNNEGEPEIIEADENNEEDSARNISLDGFNVSADSSESDDTETVNTKDIKLPLEFLMAQQRARKRIAQQEALVYLRNFKRGRKLRE